MSTRLSFRKLNEGWNAEPNAPYPRVAISGHDVLLRFLLNPFLFASFAEEDEGVLRFGNCAQYRLGATSDEGGLAGNAVTASWHRVGGSSTKSQVPIPS